MCLSFVEKNNMYGYLGTVRVYITDVHNYLTIAQLIAYYTDILTGIVHILTFSDDSC